MKKSVTLNCSDGVSVVIEADVVRGIAIHRPVYFEIDEHNNIIFDTEGKPVYQLGEKYWRLTHINSGLSVLHARTKKAAQKARTALQDVDLDHVASLDEGQRLKFLPADHSLRLAMREGNVLLPPHWIWE